MMKTLIAAAFLTALPTALFAQTTDCRPAYGGGYDCRSSGYNSGFTDTRIRPSYGGGFSVESNSYDRYNDGRGVTMNDVRRNYELPDLGIQQRSRMNPYGRRQ